MFYEKVENLNLALDMLYKTFFEKIDKKILNYKNIIIISDKFTEDLPFGMLFNKDENKYLTEKYSISYQPSVGSFVELRKELENKGIYFRTKTDTEILLKGLVEEGPDFLLKCNGMWAFCLWDRKLKKAILGRDRFGVKPLFYSFINSNNLIFGSEMKSITPFLDEIRPSQHIEEMTKRIFNYEQTQECVIDGIKRVEAGSYLIYENNKITKKRYWNTLDHIQLNNKSYSDQIESWKYLFLDSVRI